MRKSMTWLLVFLLAVSLGVAQDSATGDGAVSEPSSGPAYRVGIEDVLRVVVWGESELSMELMVRPDGMITLPLINDIQAVGLSTEEIRDAISEKLTAFVKEPAVTVILEEYNSFRVFILGEVNLQGELTFRQPTRFLQALSKAGGMTEYSRKDAVILRSVNGSDYRMPVDLKKLIAGSPDAQDPYLHPNDTILVF